MRVPVLISVGVLLGLVGLQSARAQEVDLSASAVESADVVVVGKLQSVWSYPWIDGWHSRGTIIVKEALFGKVRPGDHLRFGWNHDFGRDCLRPDWTSAKEREGVWTLRTQGDLFTADMFAGFFPRASGKPPFSACR